MTRALRRRYCHRATRHNTTKQNKTRQDIKNELSGGAGDDDGGARADARESRCEPKPRAGASPSPAETVAPECGTYSGTSRTPSPTAQTHVPAQPITLPRIRRREGQAPPLRRRPTSPCSRYPSARPTPGRRGRRPLRGRPTSPRSRLPFRVSHAGRGKPLPYGDGRTRCETNMRRRGRRPLRARRHSSGAKPRAADSRPYGRGRTWARNRRRDVEDAVPYGMVRVYGLPKGKVGRLGKFVMFFLTFLLTKSKICCTLSLGRRSEAPRRRIVRGVVPGDFFAYRSLVRIIPFENYLLSRISGDSPLFPLGRADLLPVPPPIR